MKKFLSIVAVLAIVFALAIPAFAAEAPVSSVQATAPVAVPQTVTLPDGKKADVAVEEAKNVSAEQKTALNDAVKALGTDVVAGAVVDVELKTPDGKVVSADYFKDGKTLTVAFTYDKAGDVAAVLYWNDATKAWDKADATPGADGKSFSVEFKHLCPVVFVMKDAVVVTPVDPGTGSDKPAGDKPPQSPGTGYNTVAWAAAAMALVLCASFCFVSARKKVTE